MKTNSEIFPLWRSDLKIVKKTKKSKKRIRLTVKSAVSTDHRVKITENELRDKYFEFDGELKIYRILVDGDTSCNFCARNDSQKPCKREEIEIFGRVTKR